MGGSVVFHSTHVDSEVSLLELFCPSALWLLGLKLKQSGLIAGAFTLWAILPAQKTVIYNSDQLFFFCLLVAYLFKADLLEVLLVAVCFAGVRLTWNLFQPWLLRF